MTITHTIPSEGVSLIQLSGKSASQSFSRETLPKISEVIISQLEDANVKAIVITGEGRFFSAKNIDFQMCFHIFTCFYFFE